jgi:hypothetical protein
MSKLLVIAATALAFSSFSAEATWADGAADLPTPPPSEGYAAPAPAVPAPQVYAAPPIYAAPVYRDRKSMWYRLPSTQRQS